MEKKKVLMRRLQDLLGWNGEDTGAKIEYFKDGVSLGTHVLPEFTHSLHRHIIADLLDIKDYDNFLLIRRNGETTDASSVVVDNLMVSYEDFKGSVAQKESRDYQHYLKDQEKPLCKCCGKPLWD